MVQLALKQNKEGIMHYFFMIQTTYYVLVVHNVTSLPSRATLWQWV